MKLYWKDQFIEDEAVHDTLDSFMHVFAEALSVQENDLVELLRAKSKSHSFQKLMELEFGKQANWVSNSLSFDVRHGYVIPRPRRCSVTNRVRRERMDG